jgi:predicted RNase H-like nuclease (RuvC/YqgF family)
MNKLLYLGTIGIYTFALIYTIHKYEASIKQYKDSISDYKRALSIAKNNYTATHYTWLQLENKNLNKDNEALQAKIKSMEEELGYLRNKAGIEYESHTYKSNTYDASGYEKIIDI